MSWPENEESLEERRTRWRARHAESDAAAGIETTGNFTPFRQMDDVFTRAFWDERVRTKRGALGWRCHFCIPTADFSSRRAPLSALHPSTSRSGAHRGGAYRAARPTRGLYRATIRPLPPDRGTPNARRHSSGLSAHGARTPRAILGMRSRPRAAGHRIRGVSSRHECCAICSRERKDVEWPEEVQSPGDTGADEGQVRSGERSKSRAEHTEATLSGPGDGLERHGRLNQRNGAERVE